MTNLDGTPQPVDERLDQHDLVLRAHQVAKRVGVHATGSKVFGSDSPEMVALLDAAVQVDGANGTLGLLDNTNAPNLERVETLRAAAAAKAQPPQAR